MFGSAGQTGTFHFAAQDCGLMVRYGPVKGLGGGSVWASVKSADGCAQRRKELNEMYNSCGSSVSPPTSVVLRPESSTTLDHRQGDAGRSPLRTSCMSVDRGTCGQLRLQEQRAGETDRRADEPLEYFIVKLSRTGSAAVSPALRWMIGSEFSHIPTEQLTGRPPRRRQPPCNPPSRSLAVLTDILIEAQFDPEPADMSPS
ncbi:Hypothetical protein SMAX5B_002852 [Scophthalmus maximus]|uniref:Uncharacterized protein n=1 Tax=Scophthalmus maximus TaxID=52904 RepID=A0A2U9CV46_SCOMX|nr:Hypothetical protein SMAX5B_002852 [Scophthalmus maximus]